MTMSACKHEEDCKAPLGVGMDSSLVGFVLDGVRVDIIRGRLGPKTKGYLLA